MKKWKNVILLIVIGICVCVPIVLPYFNSGYFPTHDGEWAVVRASEMFREIRDMQFPPRYSGALNFGYGYPLFNFAYPFPYYLTTILQLGNLGFVDSVKFLFASSVFVSFFGMFFLSFHFWKNKLAGLLSAILYVYLPYRMVDLYVRGSIGESLAFAIYPLILLSFLLIVERKHKGIGISCAVVLIFMLALTHNIAAVYFGFIVVAYICALLIVKKYKETLYVLVSVLWGGLLSIFFVAPALIEKEFIKLSKIPIADRGLYFVTVQKLVVPSWGYGTPTDSSPFTYQLGISQIVGFFVSLFGFKKVKEFNKSLTVCFSVLTILLILMMFPIFSMFWELPLLSEINYPWTLLLPIGFLMSFLSGGILKIKYGKIIALSLALIAIVLVLPYARPQEYVNHGDAYYLTNEGTTTSSQELMPLWVKQEPKVRFVNKIDTTAEITNLQYSSDLISFSSNAVMKEEAFINQIYYPGWKAYINNEESRLSYNNPKGVMEIMLPAGESIVELRFKETPSRLVFNTVSLLAGIVLVGFLILNVFKSIRAHR